MLEPVSDSYSAVNSMSVMPTILNCLQEQHFVYTEFTDLLTVADNLIEVNELMHIYESLQLVLSSNVPRKLNSMENIAYMETSIPS